MTDPWRGDRTPANETGDDRPPFGRSWGPLYAIVLANLAVLIVLLYILTEATS